MRVLVSACLLGASCRYDGSHCLDEGVVDLARRFDFIPACPEQLGGLCTPRPPATITLGEGEGVLDGDSSLLDVEGRDVTGHFLRGAAESLRMVEILGAEAAVLKEASPSCGVNKTNRRRRMVNGSGVTAALLRREGIPVFSESGAVAGLRDLLRGKRKI